MRYMYYFDIKQMKTSEVFFYKVDRHIKQIIKGFSKLQILKVGLIMYTCNPVFTIYGPCHAKQYLRAKRTRKSAHSDQGLRETLNTTEGMNRDQRPG